MKLLQTLLRYISRRVVVDDGSSTFLSKNELLCFFCSFCGELFVRPHISDAVSLFRVPNFRRCDLAGVFVVNSMAVRIFLKMTSSS
jgi:hypothetical protein